MIQEFEMMSLLDEKANFAHLLEQQAQEFSAKIAYTELKSLTESESLSFQELDQEAKRIASVLQEMIPAKERVLILLPTGLNFIKSLFGCFSAQVIAVPFYVPSVKDIETQLDFIQGIVKDAEIKAILTIAPIKEILEKRFWKEKQFCFAVENLPAPSKTWQKPNYSPTDLALLLYTSGSTGDPKGVMMTHGNLLHNMIQLREHNQLNDKDIVLTWLPNSPVAGIYTRLLGCFLGAQTLFFSTMKFLEDPLFWLAAIGKYRVTFSAAPNFAYDLCVQAAQHNSSFEGLDLSCWKMAISGGEIIRIQTLTRFSQIFATAKFSLNSFYPYYGLTETLCISLPRPQHQVKKQSIDRKFLNQQKIKFVEENHPNSLTLVSNGLCYQDSEMAIAHPETLEICQENEIGEICISSLSNTQGYWRKPEYSEKVCQLSFPHSEKKFFRTGDLGFINQGEIYVTGRLKELIILYGKNYYPEDIEITALQTVPENIVSVAAFSVDIASEESLILVLGYRQEMSEQEKEKLVEKLRGVYTTQHKISVYGFIIVPDSEIPRASTRKIKRSVCRDYFLHKKWSLCEPKNSTPITPVLLLEKEELLGYQEDLRVEFLAKNLSGFLSNLLKIKLKQEDLLKPIHSFGIDSIATVKIISQLSQHFKISISHQIFFDETSIHQLAKQVLAKLTQKEKRTEKKINYQKDLERVKELIPKNLPATASQMKSIFMTGATGYLGSYIIYDLLKNNSEQIIYCLIRAKDETTAFERIKSSLEKGPGWEENFREKIVPIAGTLSKKFFGLSKEKFDHLSSVVDLILHNAANVNFVAPYSYLYQDNVASLFNILELSVQKKLKPIHFVSTLAVFNSPERAKIIEETSFLPKVDRIFSGYAQSKWVAEKLLQEAQKYNVPVSVYRPGLITGDSKSGYCNTDDFLCRFIKGNLELKHFPNISIEIDMTPVDFVAKAVVHLLKAKPNTYHLANPKPINLQNYVNWLQENGFEVSTLKYSSWEKLLLENSIDNELFPLIPFLMEKQESTQQSILEFFENLPLNYQRKNTEQALATTEILCSPIDEKLLDLYMNYFIESGYITKTQMLKQ